MSEWWCYLNPNALQSKIPGTVKIPLTTEIMPTAPRPMDERFTILETIVSTRAGTCAIVSVPFCIGEGAGTQPKNCTSTTHPQIDTACADSLFGVLVVTSTSSFVGVGTLSDAVSLPAVLPLLRSDMLVRGRREESRFRIDMSGDDGVSVVGVFGVMGDFMLALCLLCFSGELCDICSATDASDRVELHAGEVSDTDLPGMTFDEGGIFGIDWSGECAKCASATDDVRTVS